MATNFVTDGSVFDYLPTAAITSGTVGRFDGRVGVALETRTAAQLADTSRSNDVNKISVQADKVFRVGTTESGTIAKGDLLFLDEGQGTLLSGVKKKASGANTYFAGTATSSKFSDNTVEIDLNANRSGANPWVVYL